MENINDLLGKNGILPPKETAEEITFKKRMNAHFEKINTDETKNISKSRIEFEAASLIEESLPVASGKNTETYNLTDDDFVFEKDDADITVENAIIQLKEKMEIAASNEDYKLASDLRDSAKNLQKILGNKKK